MKRSDVGATHSHSMRFDRLSNILMLLLVVHIYIYLYKIEVYTIFILLLPYNVIPTAWAKLSNTQYAFLT